MSNGNESRIAACLHHAMPMVLKRLVRFPGVGRAVLLKENETQTSFELMLLEGETKVRYRVTVEEITDADVPAVR